MKKVFFAVVAVAALGFSSCKKCGTCDTYTNNVKVVTGGELCGEAYDEAKAAAVFSEVLKSGVKCTDK